MNARRSIRKLIFAALLCAATGLSACWSSSQPEAANNSDCQKPSYGMFSPDVSNEACAPQAPTKGATPALPPGMQ